MENLFFELKLRWLWHGCAIVLAALWTAWFFKRHRSIHISERNFSLYLALLISTYFALGVLAKFLQLYTLQLNALDFWLHEDIIHNLATRGSALVTRFAPQNYGFTQHGAIHPSWIFYFTTPLAWIFSATAAALIFNPLVLCLAAMMIALLAQPRWGSGSALLLAFAFLVSSPVNGTLMYDMHPEAAYPLFVFLWAYGVSEGPHNWKRHLCFFLGLMGGLAIKEDGFLIFLPLTFALGLSRGFLNRQVLFSAFATALSIAFNLFLIHQWRAGAWGPATLDGLSVFIPTSVPWFRGHQWDSVSSVFAIIQALFAEHGGVLGIFKAVFGFFLSRPWLSLIVVFPWIILKKRFWILIVPLGIAYAVIGSGPASLLLYYSMPFLGLLWLCALDFPSTAKAKWILFCCLAIDGGGLKFALPTPHLKDLRAQAKGLGHCINPSTSASSPPSAVVTTPFVAFVPRSSVLSVTLPPTENPAHKLVRFVLFAPELASYETPPAALARIRDSLNTNPEWEQWDADCHPLEKPLGSSVQLFVRRAEH